MLLMSVLKAQFILSTFYVTVLLSQINSSKKSAAVLLLFLLSLEKNYTIDPEDTVFKTEVQ